MDWYDAFWKNLESVMEDEKLLNGQTPAEVLSQAYRAPKSIEQRTVDHQRQVAKVALQDTLF